jgi:colicin import membrane protein
MTKTTKKNETISAPADAQLSDAEAHSAAHPDHSCRARASAGADLAAAAARLFAPMASQPHNADSIAQYEHAMRRVTSTAQAPEQVARMHADALGKNEGLAAMFRTAECVDDIVEHASRFATPANMHEAQSDAAARAAHAARRSYMVLIAEQLEGPDAKALLAAVAAEERAASEAAQREAQAQADRERQAEEQRAAKRRARAEFDERVDVAAKAAEGARAAADAAAKEHRRLLAESVRAGLEELSLTSETIRINREIYDVRGLATAASLDNIAVEKLNAIAAVLRRADAPA